MTHDGYDHAAAHSHAHAHHGTPPSGSPELAAVLAAAGLDVRRSLDIGCGSGADVVYLARRGIDAIGIDVSEDAIASARTRAAEAGLTATWIVGDATSIPIEDASVDLATDRGCLHHLAVDDRPGYASEVARVLRPGGLLVLRDTLSHGRHEPAVTEAAIASMTTGLPLSLRSIVPFEMGPSAAVLAVLERTGSELDLFAGMPVRDLAQAIAWYSRLLGYEPSFLPNDTEAVWELDGHRFLYVDVRPEHAGHAMQTVFVSDYDERLAAIAQRGIEPAEVETYANGVRKATFRDPDGNELGLGGAPA